MYHRIVLAGVTLALSLGAGCASSRHDAPVALQPPTVAALDETLQIELGRQAVTRDNTVRVTFTGKLPDSRCAVNVVCVWAGDVGAKVRVESVTAAMDGETHTAVEPRAFWAGENQVTLLDVLPRPGESKSGGPVVATFRVRRAAR